MINVDKKERFIVENYDNEGTQKTIRNTFTKISDIEEMYNMDLDSFNKDQIAEVLGVLDCKSIESLNKEFTYIKRYKKWCAAEGYSIFDAASISFYKSDLKRYINKSAHDNQYIMSRKEFYEILDKVYNPQDKVIPVLLFEGISGRPKQEFSFEEIKNLKVHDCNYENHTIITTRNGDLKHRVLDDIDMRSMDIIFDAIDQIQYHRGNGTATGKLSILDLEESDYVLKKVSRKNNTEDINTAFIDSKINFFKKVTELYWVNAKKIQYSGMFDRLQNIESAGNELSPQEYKDICKRFLINENRWNVIKDKYLAFKAIGSKG